MEPSKNQNVDKERQHNKKKHISKTNAQIVKQKTQVSKNQAKILKITKKH